MQISHMIQINQPGIQPFLPDRNGQDSGNVDLRGRGRGRQLRQGHVGPGHLQGRRLAPRGRAGTASGNPAAAAHHATAVTDHRGPALFRTLQGGAGGHSRGRIGNPLAQRRSLRTAAGVRALHLRQPASGTALGALSGREPAGTAGRGAVGPDGGPGRGRLRHGRTGGHPERFGPDQPAASQHAAGDVRFARVPPTARYTPHTAGSGPPRDHPVQLHLPHPYRRMELRRPGWPRDRAHQYPALRQQRRHLPAGRPGRPGHCPAAGLHGAPGAARWPAAADPATVPNRRAQHLCALPHPQAAAGEGPPAGGFPRPGPANPVWYGWEDEINARPATQSAARTDPR